MATGWVLPVGPCCVGKLREFLTVCPLNFCHRRRVASAGWAHPPAGCRWGAKDAGGSASGSRAVGHGGEGFDGQSVISEGRAPDPWGRVPEGPDDAPGWLSHRAAAGGLAIW